MRRMKEGLIPLDSEYWIHMTERGHWLDLRSQANDPMQFHEYDNKARACRRRAIAARQAELKPEMEAQASRENKKKKKTKNSIPEKLVESVRKNKQILLLLYQKAEREDLGEADVSCLGRSYKKEGHGMFKIVFSIHPWRSFVVKIGKVKKYGGITRSQIKRAGIPIVNSAFINFKKHFPKEMHLKYQIEIQEKVARGSIINFWLFKKEVCEKWGKKAKKMLDILDFHDKNVGWKNNSPILFDW